MYLISASQAFRLLYSCLAYQHTYHLENGLK